ncbi:MAG: hypothetical protein ACREE4_12595 [Stellaceae bacterium]
MTDWNETVLPTHAVEDPIGEAAERGIEHLKAIAAELFEASRSAAQSVLDEEKDRAARQVAAVAAAVRSAAQSLDHAKLPTLARYTEEAAGSVAGFGQALSGRRWGELADDLEILARRQPALFLAAAAVIGLLSGRLLWSSSRRAAAAERRQAAQARAVARENEAVTAAIASAPGGNGLAAPAAGVSDTQDMRP